MTTKLLGRQSLRPQFKPEVVEIAQKECLVANPRQQNQLPCSPQVTN